MTSQFRNPDFFQRKSLSQVFLKESWPCTRVAQQLQQLGIRQVLEIGPGAGIMTIELIKAGLNVTAVEKDSRLIEQLKGQGEYIAEQVNNPGSLEVVNQDILKFDLQSWVRKNPSHSAVVGNIPYNISSPILLWLLPHISELSIAFLLVQFEFAMRIISKHGTKDYGSLSVFTQLRSHVNLEFKVDRKIFRPVPKVDSAMISLTKANNEYSENLLNITEKFTRASFMQRRKKLRNSVRAFLNDLNDENFPVDLDRRAETLTPQEFIQCGEYILTNSNRGI